MKINLLQTRDKEDEMPEAYFIGQLFAVLLFGITYGYGLVLVIRAVQGYRKRFRNKIF
jgi:hypothetical protein